VPNPLIERGRQAARAGDYAAMERAADARLMQAPDDLDALELLALAQIRRADTAGALATLRRALSLDARAAWAHGDLVLLLHQTGARGEAIEAAHQALRALPDDANLHSLMGIMRSEIEDLSSGERHLRRALALAGAHAQILQNLAANLLRQGRLDEADALFAQADAASPDNADVLSHWARLAEARGDFSTALARLERAERLGRDISLQRAVTLGRKGEIEAALAIIDAVSNPGGDALLERGRLLDRLGRYAEAWRSFLAGKARLAARDHAQYGAEDVERRFEALKAALSPALFDATRCAPVRADVPQPIFVLGFPRSGTTMLEQMLSSHSAIRAGGELPFAAEMENIAKDQFGDEYLSALAKLPQADAARFAAQLRDHYLARAAEYGLVGGPRFFTDKMPLNETWLPLIRLAFPTTPLLRMERHPLDVCVSMMAHHMTHGFQCGYRLEDIATHMRAVDDLVVHCERAGIALFAFRYEDLVRNQEVETRRLLDHLGLGFEAACLRFHENPRHAPTPSYAQVTAPLNDRSIGRWTHYADELAPVIPALTPLIQRLGYSEP